VLTRVSSVLQSLFQAWVRKVSAAGIGGKIAWGGCLPVFLLICMCSILGGIVGEEPNAPTASSRATPAVVAEAEPTTQPTKTPEPTNTPQPTSPPLTSEQVQATNCDPAYPDMCIPPPPPDLDCGDIPGQQFKVLPPDPHRLDPDGDGTGCESEGSLVTSNNAPEPTAMSAQPKPERGGETAQVIEVVDGDTVKVLLNSQEQTLRMIGMDTPETKHPSKPVECFGQEASAKAQELLNGQTVTLEADPSQGERDTFDRLLRYIRLADGRLFNQEMIAQGYAYEYTYDLPYKYQAEFKQAQQQADAQDLGLWSPAACNGERIAVQPAPEPTIEPAIEPVIEPAVEPAPVVPEPAAGCHPSYPDFCIPSPPPDLNCGQIAQKRFTVLPPDPHRFDGNKDGIGCES
jgi:endonuclease YncB( thermonuclease family)